MREVVFNLGGDKAPGPAGFPFAFFQRFCEDIKDVFNFMREFRDKGILSKHIGAAFITLIAKKATVECINDYRPISLIGSIYKILAKVLATRL